MITAKACFLVLFFIIIFIFFSFFLAPPPASLMELPAQEGPGTSRDSAPVSYQLKVSELLYFTFLGALWFFKAVGYRRAKKECFLYTYLSKPLTRQNLYVLTQESSYIFREGMLPPHRQMFYQLCDLDVERCDVIHESRLTAGYGLLGLQPYNTVSHSDASVCVSSVLNRWSIRTAVKSRHVRSVTAGASPAPKTNWEIWSRQWSRRSSEPRNQVRNTCTPATSDWWCDSVHWMKHIV